MRKKFGGRKAGTQNKVTEKIRDISQSLLARPMYQEMLKAKLDAGTLHPSVEAMLYYYAFGKPKEVIESTLPTSVKIIHEFAGAPDASTNVGT